MEDLDNSLFNTKEAKKFSLGYRIQALQELIKMRFQSLTIISMVSFAVVGIFISFQNDLIKNGLLAFLSFGFLILIALISFGRYLYLIRKDIKSITQKIRDLPQEDWNQPLEEQEFKADYWPETITIRLGKNLLMTTNIFSEVFNQQPILMRMP